MLLGSAYGLWYGLSVGYFFFAYPDWMLVYLQDGAQIYKPVAYLFFLFIMAGCGAAGATTAGWMLVQGRRNWATLISAAGLAAVFSIWRITWNQYWHVGTYQEFLRGAAPNLEDVHPFQVAMNVVGALIAVPFVAGTAWRYMSGRKAQGSGAKAPGAAPAPAGKKA